MCDISIAETTAMFGLPEMILGVIPGTGGPARLTRAMGKAKAMYCVLAGKESVSQQAGIPLIPGLKHGRRLFHGLFGTPDQKEGMAAFAEKRKPNYTKYQNSPIGIIALHDDR